MFLFFFGRLDFLIFSKMSIFTIMGGTGYTFDPSIINEDVISVIYIQKTLTYLPKFEKWKLPSSVANLTIIYGFSSRSNKPHRTIWLPNGITCLSLLDYYGNVMEVGIVVGSTKLTNTDAIRNVKYVFNGDTLRTVKTGTGIKLFASPYLKNVMSSGTVYLLTTLINNQSMLLHIKAYILESERVDLVNLIQLTVFNSFNHNLVQIPKGVMVIVHKINDKAFVKAYKNDLCLPHHKHKSITCKRISTPFLVYSVINGAIKENELIS